MDAWLVVNYTVGAALERMALLEIEAVLRVVFTVAVERRRCRRERGLSELSGGCHVGSERVNIFTIHD